MTFFIVLFLLLMQFLWRYIDELVGKGLEFNIIGELMLYASAGLVTLALPLAVLMSSLMTFGNMGENYELTAMKSSGISLGRILLPLIILVVLISVGAFFFANNVLPVTNLKMKSLLYDVRQQRPEVSISEGVFYNGIDNYSIRVNRKDPVNNMLYDIKIYDHTARRGNVKITTADSGQMKMTADRRHLVVTLWNGHTYSELQEERRRRNKNYPHQIDKFGEQRIIIEMTGFELSRSDESIFRNSYTMLNTSQLQRTRDSLETELNNKSRDFYHTLIEKNYFKMNAKIGQRPPPPNFSANAEFLQQGLMNQQTSAEAYKPRTVRAHPSPGPEGNQSASSATGSGAVKRPMLRSDSALAKRPALKIRDFDSLFNAQSLGDKREVVRTAMNWATLAQYLVVNVSSNIIFETKYLRRHEIEWHRKFTLSFACLIFLFIGAPLGAIIRKGGLGMPTVISTLLFILYYIMSLTGEKFVRESVLTSFQGMWLSSFILVIAGVFLTYEATNDSAILNLDAYLNWLRDKMGLRKGIMLDKKTHLTGKFDLLEIPKAQLQADFAAMNEMARKCLDTLKAEVKIKTLINRLFNNIGFPCLIEFGIHYNSLFDEIILSKWFRIPYFAKRMIEFPFINGRTNSRFFDNRLFTWISVAVFPLFLLRLIRLYLKLNRIKRNLRQVNDLSTGMINLLNSAAMRTELEAA